MTGAALLAAAGSDPIIALGANKTIVSVGGAGIGVASVQLTSAGVWNGGPGLEGGTGAFSSTWITPQVLESQYEVFATLNSGTVSSGTTGSWLNLGTTRLWSKTGAATATLTLDIRRVGTTTVLDSVDVSLTGS